MNGDQPTLPYIEISRTTSRPEKISSVLEKRMKALMRERRRQLRLGRRGDER